MGAVVFVGGVGDIAAGVADAGGKDAGHFPDQVLHAPKATSGKDGPLGFLGHFSSPCSVGRLYLGFSAARFNRRSPGIAMSNMAPAIIEISCAGATRLSGAGPGNCRWLRDAISDPGHREATMSVIAPIHHINP